MLFRKRKKDITQWIKDGKNALLVTGARQTGKTFLIQNLLEQERCDYVEFNLIKQPEVVEILDAVKDQKPEVFLSRLTLLSSKELVKGKTVIFFDEIQMYKEILTAIKFLVLEGSFRYVLSGSLLGVELVGIRSAPVGYLTIIQLFPMDFEEYLMALKIQKSSIESLRSCFEKREPVDEFIHKKLLEVFYTYLVVGGMPAAVQNYVDEHDFNKVIRIHDSIRELYKLDYSQYEQEHKLKLVETYNLIPAELNSKNKRYIFTDLNKHLKFERYESSFAWLCNAGVALPVFNTTEPKVPLESNKKSNLFKLFLSDVGMLSTMYGRAAQLKLLNSGQDMNCGAVFENFVAQELVSHGYKGYYYSGKRLGEIDFLIEYENECLPIEVKSGKDYSVHPSLDKFLNDRNYSINQAFVLSSQNVSVDGKIVYLPIYMTMFINENSIELPSKASFDPEDFVKK